MVEKAKEFVDKGSEIYQGNVPENAKILIKNHPKIKC
jgi:hypothetical protein